MKTASSVAGGIVNQKSASLVNSFRLAAVAQRLGFYVDSGRMSNAKELIDFRNCCISLAKGIDFAIANNEVPSKAGDLPSLLLKVCHRRSEHHFIYSALMVMMISVKNACQLGWFQQSDSQELLALSEEIWNGFGSPGGSSPNLEGPGTPFSQIMERFYPFMKLGYTLVSLEVKPGCTILTKDFHISKKMPHSTQQKIRLFVAHIDNIETSACIINPPEVSFLLNGKAVEKRVNIQMDTGPQLPTNVTGLLKYGTNLLQAMGNFKGHYIIVLAFTDVILLSEAPVLKDCVQSESVELNSDADLIEGPSRISLNCPISHTRIKLPVKGHLCKHLQCFDFSNYVNINMRKPSWRCPHCNQPVSYTDICVDQNMVQVLKEVGYNAADVIISTGGSWKVVMENDEKMEPVNETIHDCDDPTSILNSGPIVLDLTGDEDEIGTFSNTEVEDRKPLLSDIQVQSSNADNTALNEVFTGFHIANGMTLDSSFLNEFVAPSNSMPQPPQTSDTAIGQEYANLSQIPRSRHPIAVQALPVPSLHTSVSQNKPSNTTPVFSTLIPTSQSASPITPVGDHIVGASQVQTSSAQSRPATTAMFSTQVPPSQSSQVHTSFVTPIGDTQGRTSRLMERWRPYYRNSSQVPPMASSQNHPSVQNQRHPMRSQFPATQRQPPPSLAQSQTATVSHQNRLVSQRFNQAGPTVQSVSRVSDLMDQATVNTASWRPQGRMRGSLVPGSGSSALDHMIIRPTQQSQGQTSQPRQSMAPFNIQVDIQGFLANGNRARGTSIPQTETVTFSSPMTAPQQPPPPPPPPGFTGLPGTW